MTKQWFIGEEVKMLKTPWKSVQEFTSSEIESLLTKLYKSKENHSSYCAGRSVMARPLFSWFYQYWGNIKMNMFSEWAIPALEKYKNSCSLWSKRTMHTYVALFITKWKETNRCLLKREYSNIRSLYWNA